MTMHKPPQDMLFDYASGSLPEALSIIVAAHLELCPGSRDDVRAAEDIGGALLDALDPAELSDDFFAQTMARLDQPASAPCPPARRFDEQTHALIPAPLRRYLPASLVDLDWRRAGPALEEARIPLPGEGYKASLYRIKPDRHIPVHTHGGNEFTLVLDGGFSDDGQHFVRGDVAVADATREHSPTADPEGCLSFAIIDAPLKLTGPFGRLLNPFMRF